MNSWGSLRVLGQGSGIGEKAFANFGFGQPASWMSGDLAKAGCAQVVSIDDVVLECLVEQPQDSVADDFLFLGELAQSSVSGKQRP